MDGYSKKTLKEKLGLKAGMKVCLLNIPDNYFQLTGDLYNDIDLELKDKYDFIHFFAKDQMSLFKNINSLKDSLLPNGILWISWPKLSSRIVTDIKEQAVRDFSLPLGFVDIKVCAIDNTWSALKLVVRKA